MKIEALHDFHDPIFSATWADRFEPTPERMRLFQDMRDLLTQQLEGQKLSVLELGIGPGFLAQYLLNELPEISYEGLDFAQAMLDLANKRNQVFSGRLQLTQADLVAGDWTKQIQQAPQVVISTWALHDLLAKEHIGKVYQNVFDLLPEGGLLLNGDFIKPESSRIEYEAGRIKPSEQLELLHLAGFKACACNALYDTNLDAPTPANNYALFMAIK